MMLFSMDRWVQRHATRVTFGNIIAGMSGQTSSFEFTTEGAAMMAAAYLVGRDPDNKDLPVPFGPVEQKRFGAKEVK